MKICFPALYFLLLISTTTKAQADSATEKRVLHLLGKNMQGLLNELVFIGTVI
jgi:hypothetical protein